MKFTNVAYINMDHRVDKNDAITKELKTCPEIPITRFSGHYATNFCDYQVENYITHGSHRHRGVIGCWIAHQKLLESYKDNINDDWLLVFEDDAKIFSAFWIFSSIIQPPEDTEILFFDTYKSKNPIDPKHIIDNNYKIYNIYGSWPNFVGTHCYAIKYSAINKVYNILNSVKVYKDIDGYIFNNPNIIKYNCQSQLIKTNNNLSSDRLNDTWRI
jgi:GR25 family glycosyltransferase involved in LPS biosynthesis